MSWWAWLLIMWSDVTLEQDDDDDDDDDDGDVDD